MFKSLKRKLLLFYTFITGLVLTLILVFVLISNIKNLRKEYTDRIMQTMNEYITMLSNDNTISLKSLSRDSGQELGHFVADIYDNGNRLKYVNNSMAGDTVLEMFGECRTFAEAEGIFTDRNSSYTGSVYELSGGGIRKKLGMAARVVYNRKTDTYILAAANRGSMPYVKQPDKKVYRDILLVYDAEDYGIRCVRSIIGILLIDIMGILVFMFTGHIILERIIYPMEENDRRQKRFVAAASHELRSPLAVIRANVSLISDGGQDVKSSAAVIDRESIRMARLIDDMLLLASAENSTWDVKLEEINPEDLIIDGYEAYQSLCREKNITLKTELPEKILPYIKGDEERLGQLMGILINNAISYSPEKTDIIIRAESVKNVVRIMIIDHGCGVPDDKKKLIFDSFYRADKSRKDKEHFGLGLSIAREIMELHHGRIMVADTAGGGSTFILEFKI